MPQKGVGFEKSRVVVVAEVGGGRLWRVWAAGVWEMGVEIGGLEVLGILCFGV